MRRLAVLALLPLLGGCLDKGYAVSKHAEGSQRVVMVRDVWTGGLLTCLADSARYASITHSDFPVTKASFHVCSYGTPWDSSGTP